MALPNPSVYQTILLPSSGPQDSRQYVSSIAFRGLGGNVIGRRLCHLPIISRKRMNQA